MVIGAPASVAASSSDMAMTASSWEIGPIINGMNYSVNLPPTPTQDRGRSWHIDIPRDDGELHYVTFNHGSLAGKRQIVMRYRVDLARGAQILPARAEGQPATLTLYFQRSGDNWSGRRRYHSYRWYANFASERALTAGVHTVTVPLDGPWTSVQGKPQQDHPREYAAALANAGRVGFVMGSPIASGHGVYATGRARLTVLDFRVE